MKQAKGQNNRTYISWRWRIMVPLFALVLIVVTVGVYASAGRNGLLPAGDDIYAVQARQQLLGLLLATLAAGVVIVIFVGISLLLERLNIVATTAEALAAGHSNARTRMNATDEVGVLGAALDRYAESVQKRHDALRSTLRRQRREVAHLTAVLEALPDGVVVLDMNGHVILVNDQAKNLLNSQQELQTADLNALTASVTDALGPSLAPGIYALGDPQQVEVQGKMLSAQAAAVMSLNDKRVGTVIVLRDITAQVRRAQAREVVMQRVAKEIQEPLQELGRRGALSHPDNPMHSFAREINRQSVALQKLIVEMRELTAELDTRSLQHKQRPLAVDTLIWAVANEWRQIAEAANLSLKVLIEQQGLFVLGDERRLRWALGNLVDNAIKYTQPGGEVTLEVRGEANRNVQIVIMDDGVGIAADEMARVFTRFYRGNPVTDGGRAIRVPGTGQGLSIAQHIIETHGGSIELKSAQFVGTTAHIFLPLTAPVSMELPRLTIGGADMEGETVRVDHDETEF